MDEKEKEKEIEAPKVNSKEGVQEFVDNTTNYINEFRVEMKAKDDQIKKLEEANDAKSKEISDIGDLVVINKGNFKDNDDQKARDYQLGEWFARWRLGFFKTTGRGGTVNQEKSNERLLSKGYRSFGNLQKADLEKANLGTPLTGDDSGTDTSNLIPTNIYETEILRIADITSEVIPLFARRAMTNRQHIFPVEGTTASWTAVTNESTDKTESNPTWTTVTLVCETWATWVGITDELLEDTFADIGSQIRVQLLEDYITTVEEQMLDATTPFTGICRETGTQTHSMNSSSISDLEWDDMQATIEKLTSRKLRGGAVFIMHPTVWDLLARAQDAIGNYYWLPTSVVPRMCRGYPVKLSDNMPSVSDDAASKAFIVFGNPKWLFYGIRIGVEFGYYDQTFYAVQDDENFWRARTRFGTKVAIPANYALLKTGA